MAVNATRSIADHIPVAGAFSFSVDFFLRVAVGTCHFFFVMYVRLKSGVLPVVLRSDAGTVTCRTCFPHGRRFHEGVSVEETSTGGRRPADMALAAACMACAAVTIHGLVGKGLVSTRPVEDTFAERIESPVDVAGVKRSVMAHRAGSVSIRIRWVAVYPGMGFCHVVG